MPRPFSARDCQPLDPPINRLPPGTKMEKTQRRFDLRSPAINRPKIEGFQRALLRRLLWRITPTIV
jgi:hypothetical protein